MPATEAWARPRLPHVALFAVSGLASAALAGILVVLLTFGAAGGLSAGMLILIGAIEAVRVAILVAGLPATLLGGLLWSAGAKSAWARHPATWAAAGALAGVAGYFAALSLGVQALQLLAYVTELGPAVLAAMFALAGAASALAFRGSMKLFLLFLPDPPAD